MNTEQLTALALQALEDLKGKNILVMDVRSVCDFTDSMIFCTGTSNRHVKSLAKNLVDEAKKQEQSAIGVEGEEAGEWVLVDFGDVVVHIMQKEVRDFYKIEELWQVQPASSA